MTPNPYSVYNNGKKFFGNIQLKELHLFSYDRCNYLVNVQQKKFHLVPPSLEHIINTVLFGELISENGVQALQKYDIIQSHQQEHSTNECASFHKKELAVTNMSLFVSQECNMACVYCYGEGGSYSGSGLMKEEVAFTAVDWLIKNSKSSKKIKISFFGGEPLLNFDGLVKNRNSKNPGS